MQKKPNNSTPATFGDTRDTPLSNQDWTVSPRIQADSELLMPGSHAGEYVIDALIGRGGMGAVYAARQPVIGKRVAVKVLSARLRDAPAAERFVREAQAVNRIGHPNIVDIFAFGTLPDGRHYYVMELLRGQCLRDRLLAGPLMAAEIEHYVTQLCAALQAAHDAGIVHRDLKPENIWLTRNAQADSLKLLDFGIAKFFEAEPRREALTESGTALGTPAYMSPEQCSGTAIDARTDIYALGIILYEIYMGHLPFEGDAMQLFVQHLTATPPAATRAPGAVAELIADCLAKDPAQRPQEAEEVSERMTQAAGWQLGELATLPSQPVVEQARALKSQPRRSPFRRRVLTCLLLAAVGGALAKGIWPLLTRPQATHVHPAPLASTSTLEPATTLPAAAEPPSPASEAITPLTAAELPAPATPAVAPIAPRTTVPLKKRHAEVPSDDQAPTSNAQRRGLAVDNPFR